MKEMAARNRKWAEARSASRSEMRGPCARGEVATDGRGTWSEPMTWASSSIPWRYYWVPWAGKTKESRCSNQSKKRGKGWRYKRRDEHGAPSYTHERWPLLNGLKGSRPKLSRILASGKLLTPLANYIEATGRFELEINQTQVSNTQL